MRKLKILHLIGLFSLLGVSQASAQESVGRQAASVERKAAPSLGSRIRVGAFIGGNYLSSDNELGNSFHSDQVPGSGFLFGLRGSYLILDSIAPDSAVKPQLSGELEGKLTISSTEGGMGRESVSTPVAGWRANAVLDLFPDNKVVPFALLGIGGETVFGSNKFMTSPETDFATYIGGGARYPLRDKLDLRGDLRLGFTAGRESSIASLFEFHAGVAYRFGKSSESVAQPTAEVVVVEPSPPFADADKDGIADDADMCPRLAEVQNGIDDADGCPEVDSDNDGLLGSKDECPAAAEDLDGFEDGDGCPDLDNDGDGRPDVMDQCPAKAETLNGYEDDDGCPDEVPTQVQEFTGTIEGIRFRTGSARILRRSRKILDKAFLVLRDNPSVRIEISGHTDNRGSADNNRALSRKRADYVKWYLVDKGIAAERIRTVGHGPDKPLGDNDTREGRKKNRRIEFRLLPGESRVEPPSRPAPAAKPGAATDGSSATAPVEK